VGVKLGQKSANLLAELIDKFNFVITLHIKLNILLKSFEEMNREKYYRPDYS